MKPRLDDWEATPVGHELLNFQNICKTTAAWLKNRRISTLASVSCEDGIVEQALAHTVSRRVVAILVVGVLQVHTKMKSLPLLWLRLRKRTPLQYQLKSRLSPASIKQRITNNHHSLG
jgi:hypothetical protein